MIEQVLRMTITICIVIGVTGQSVTTGPSNMVALVGTTVTLNCSTSLPSDFFFWDSFPVGIFPGNCWCGDPCSPSYFKTTLTFTSCNLTIPAAQVSLNVAGTYTCSPAIGSRQSAQLIILGSNPVCTTNTSGYSIIIGQSVSMSCTVNYSATVNTYSLSMTWTGAAFIVPIYSNSSTMVSSTLIVATSSASIPYVQPYTCITQLINLTTPAPNFATNIPSYSSTYIFPPLMVLYAPFANNISFTGSDLLQEGPQLGKASINSTLTCSAVGYPGATFTYLWTSPNGSNTSGPAITLSHLGSNLVYVCTVTNVIGNCSNFISVTVTTTTTTQIPVAGLTSVQLGLIIGFCVGIPVVIIGVTLLCCFYRRCPYYHKASCFNAKPSNVDVKVIYEDLHIPRQLDQPENRIHTDLGLTSDPQANPIYENTLILTRPQQDVSASSHYQELIKGTTTISGDSSSI